MKNCALQIMNITTDKTALNKLGVQTNIPLAQYTWFGTGGPARFFTQPTTVAAYAKSLDFAHKQKLDIFVLGQGANILISDSGFDGIVIRPQVSVIKIVSDEPEYSLVQAGAGTVFADLITYCLEHDLTGPEEFIGIPGTVGGSVFINIHYYDFLLSQFLVKAEVIERATGKIIKVDFDWFNFGYNQSRLFDRQHYLVSATFRFAKTTKLQTAFNKGRSVEIFRHRTKRFPYKRTCGSFFRNFAKDELTNASLPNPCIYVAFYLDNIGAKGTLSVGNAGVSYQHANMIVAEPGSTSQDIVQLARLMQQKVIDRFNLIPRTECLMVGFDKYPLLQP
ncbi:UDP-N-acetylmuramate dehydrogenase [bacterium]|nr:UDP-N-acetylmuramate dehydrogenase [bacterium]